MRREEKSPLWAWIVAAAMMLGAFGTPSMTAAFKKGVGEGLAVTAVALLITAAVIGLARHFTNR